MKTTRIIRIILFALGVLALGNVAFMYSVANPTIGFHLQAIIAVVVMAYAILLPKISKKIHIITGSICLILVIFVTLLFIYGNVSNVDYTEDVVIVLGAGVRGETVSRPLAARLNTAVDYWHRNPDAYIITTGGLGNLATITEAEAMARFLVARGVPRERILLEEYSTSTYENLVFAREILDEHFQGEFRAVLVTNDFHIYRAVRTARLAGIYPNRIGAPTDWYAFGVNYLREMVAVLNFKISGS